MAETYDGALGTTVNVFPQGADVSVGFTSTIVLVGKNEDGTADNYEAITVDDTDEVEEEFGEDSGLVGAFTAARSNGADEIWAVGVDPEDPDWEAGTEAAINILPRYIYIDSHESEAKNTAVGVAEDYATDLEFTRVFAPISEEVDSADVGDYEPDSSSMRAVEVAPQNATVGGEETYTAAAVVGAASNEPLGSSLAYDQITVDELATEYRPSVADNFERVTAVTKDATIVDGLTTSDEGAFSDIFQMEIVDTAALGLDEIAQDYAGSSVNTEDQRDSLASAMRIYLESLASQSPPLLADAFGGDPYVVDVDVGGDADEVIVNAGVNPVDVMKKIMINLNVGRVTTLEGVDAE